MSVVLRENGRVQVVDESSEAGVLLRIESLPAFVVCVAFDEVHKRRQPIGIVLPVKCKGFGGKGGIPFRIGLLPEEGTGAPGKLDGALGLGDGRGVEAEPVHEGADAIGGHAGLPPDELVAPDIAVAGHVAHGLRHVFFEAEAGHALDDLMDKLPEIFGFKAEVPLADGIGGEGVELFEGSAITNFQAVTACYPEMVQIVVRKDSGIQTVEDMRGKNVCVGAVGSGYEVAARQILDIYGMSYDDINETFADQSTAKNGVQDGTFDAMFLCSGYPNGNVTELSLGGNIELVSIDDEHLAALIEKYPYYSAFTTESDDYNLGHSVTSVAVKCMLVCLDTISDDAIYDLTKTIYENLDEIREINKKADYMSLEDALSGIPSDLHPGAARYYEEQGLTIPDYLK